MDSYVFIYVFMYVSVYLCAYSHKVRKQVSKKIKGSNQAGVGRPTPRPRPNLKVMGECDNMRMWQYEYESMRM